MPTFTIFIFFLSFLYLTGPLFPIIFSTESLLRTHTHTHKRAHTQRCVLYKENKKKDLAWNTKFSITSIILTQLSAPKRKSFFLFFHYSRHLSSFFSSHSNILTRFIIAIFSLLVSFFHSLFPPFFSPLLH